MLEEEYGIESSEDRLCAGTLLIHQKMLLNDGAIKRTGSLKRHIFCIKVIGNQSGPSRSALSYWQRLRFGQKRGH